MSITIRNIVFSCADPFALAAFYAGLLGMRRIRDDWDVIAHDESALPRLAFGDGPGEYRAPRWPDPEYPQQVHLDIPVADLDAAEEIALGLGARQLQDRGNYRSYADPAGHPFCLYRDAADGRRDNRPIYGDIGAVVFDCFSPRALAAFYTELLGMRVRKHDSERWVEIAWDDGTLPMLAFQHANVTPPRWPDPAYPQQIHLDLHVTDSRAAQDLALRLGAIRLPEHGGSCPVYADPAAHPFCLCAPGE